MAKRTPRQELRATPTRASYRREKSSAEPAAPDQDPPLPVPIPAAAPAPIARKTAKAKPAPTPVESPAPTPAPAVLPDILATFDLLAVARSALGFAAAALDPMPAPDQIVPGDPNAAEPPPGRAPAGDARSLRMSEEFVFIYRHGSAIVSRRGVVGQRGAWRVLDYPGHARAAHAYAVECSRLIEQGFRDVE